MRIKIIFVFLISQFSSGQIGKTVFINDTHSYHGKGRNNDFNNPQIINEITINNDSTFQFYSRPEYSCSSWKSYKGTWETKNDTIIFKDQYYVEEDDVRFFYNRTSEDVYILKFSTDKNSALTNRKVMVALEYDFDSKLENIKRELVMNSEDVIEIPFSSIPNQDKISNLRIEYQFNSSNRRYGFITENNTINVKYGSVPNIVEIEFVETPEKQIVHRTTKFLLKGKNLLFLSSFKNKTKMKDYFRTIEFEKIYKLEKQ